MCVKRTSVSINSHENGTLVVVDNVEKYIYIELKYANK